MYEAGVTMSLQMDPVCGMSIDPATAAGSLEYEGANYYFCSKHCLQRFKTEPAAYVNKAPEPMFHLAMPHSVQLSIRGTSLPVMSPVQSVQTTRPAETAYTCPMHPEILRDEPGSCPICGMALEPRIIKLDEPANPELADMTRRFWWSLALTLPVFLLAMAE